MKRFLALFFFLLLILSIAGCSQGTASQKAEQSPITEKLYIYNNSGDVFDFDFLWFNTDGTFQGFEIISIGNTASHYGTYELKDNSVTLNYGEANYIGVIREDGNKIYFDDAEFLDWTDNTRPDDPIYDKITK